MKDILESMTFDRFDKTYLENHNWESFKIEIISIRRKNWLERFFSLGVDYYKVRIKLETGELVDLDCYAGSEGEETPGNLIRDISTKINKILNKRDKTATRLSKLEGLALDIRHPLLSSKSEAVAIKYYDEKNNNPSATS